MANTDSPWGLKPILLDESKDCHMYPITSNYGTALFHNDPVVRVTAGTIERAAAGGPVLGSIVALFVQSPANQYFPDNLTPVQYMPAAAGASTQYWALVSDNPNMFYTIQEDGDTTPLVLADIGNNVDMIFTHAGNTTTGISGCEIDSTAKSVTADYQLKLISLADHIEPGSGVRTLINSAWAKWIVKINEHQLGANSVGI